MMMSRKEMSEVTVLMKISNTCKIITVIGRKVQSAMIVDSRVTFSIYYGWKSTYDENQGEKNPISSSIV